MACVLRGCSRNYQSIVRNHQHSVEIVGGICSIPYSASQAATRRAAARVPFTRRPATGADGRARKTVTLLHADAGVAGNRCRCATSRWRWRGRHRLRSLLSDLHRSCALITHAVPFAARTAARLWLPLPRDDRGASRRSHVPGTRAPLKQRIAPWLKARPACVHG